MPASVMPALWTDLNPNIRAHGRIVAQWSCTTTFGAIGVRVAQAMRHVHRALHSPEQIELPVQVRVMSARPPCHGRPIKFQLPNLDIGVILCSTKNTAEMFAAPR